MDTINIYCDESCHLENDKEKVMVLGAVYCPMRKKVEIFKRLLELKRKHNLIPKTKKTARIIELITNSNGIKFLFQN